MICTSTYRVCIIRVAWRIIKLNFESSNDVTGRSHVTYKSLLSISTKLHTRNRLASILMPPCNLFLIGASGRRHSPELCFWVANNQHLQNDLSCHWLSLCECYLPAYFVVV